MMKFEFKEIVKDLAFGIAAVAGVVLVMTGLISFMEMINMTKDNIRLAIFVPIFLYFCYMFGTLTRSMYFTSKD